MNKSLGNGVGHILPLFLFLVQFTSSTSLHLKADLIPFVRNARQSNTGCKLPPLPNGHYSTLLGVNVKPGQTVARGTFIDIECDVGYTASEDFTICMITNTWSDQWQCSSNAGQAEAGCKLPPLPNGHYNTYGVNEKPGETVAPFTLIEIKCDVGYIASEPAVAYCRPTNTWSRDWQCSRVASSSGCVLPEMPANGAYVIQKKDGVFTPGSSVEDLTILEYTCNKGYVVTKTLSVCQSTILDPIPVCEIACELKTSNTVNSKCTSDPEHSSSNKMPMGKPFTLLVFIYLFICLRPF